MQILPKISIITVVRNGEAFIDQTIQSIVQQTYQNFEYIVIDGNSSDNTVNIIEKYTDKIAYWISEKDEGIYDAMNKGIKAATGDWLLFINADDFLFDNYVIEKAAKQLANSPSLVAYGNVVIIYASGSEIVRGADWDSLKQYFRKVRMNISHQGVFHAKKLFEGRLYDKSLRIVADYDILLSYLKNHDAQYLPMTIAKMRAIGVSSTSGNLKMLKEIRRAQIKNKVYKFFPSPSWLYYAFKISFVSYVIKIFGESGKDAFKNIFGLRQKTRPS